MPVAPLLPADDLERIRSLVGTRWNRLRNTRILVTGGTGFVGRWLLASLIDANARLDLGCEATVLTRRPEAVRRETPWLAEAPGIRWIEGDVRRLDRIEALADAAFDHVVHAATDVRADADPLDTFTTCVDGTRQVLELARRAGSPSMLLVSSGAVYGPPAPDTLLLQEEQTGGPAPFRAASAYAEGKRAAECLAAAFAAKHGLDLRVARCFAFVGPYLPLDGGFAIGNFLRDAIADRPILLRGDGTPLRSYLHASDMAAWLWSLLIGGRPGTAYNVGSDVPIALGELARLVNRIAGSTGGVQMGSHRREGLAPDRYVPQVERIMADLALAPPLPLDASIDRTLRWLRSGAR